MLIEAPINGFKVTESDEPVDVQIKNALEKFGAQKPNIYKQRAFEKALRFVERDKAGNELTGGVGLALTNDIRPNYENEGCIYRQAAAYFTNGYLMWNKDIVSKMSKTNQAALWVHEAIYKELRMNYVLDSSIPVRELVGMLFGDATSAEVLRKLDDIKHSGKYLRKTEYSVAEKIELVGYALDSKTLHCVNESRNTEWVNLKSEITRGIGLTLKSEINPSEPYALFWNSTDLDVEVTERGLKIIEVDDGERSILLDNSLMHSLEVGYVNTVRLDYVEISIHSETPYKVKLVCSYKN